SGAPPSVCQAPYAQANCLNYLEGVTQVSSGGRNYLCANPNCRNCTSTPSCAPGQTGCPWGVVWQDNGACGGSGGGGASCSMAYAQSSCAAYLTGTVVSNGGKNWTCANGNCAQCANTSTCAPGQTGCPWGT